MQPDVGESTNQLVASVPGEVPSNDLKLTKDGFIFIDPNKFAAEVGSDLLPAQAEYMANSQMPVAAASLNAPVTVAAWHDKPSYGIVATGDRVLSPMLARWMYKRSGAKITEIRANRLVNVCQLRAVARIIEAAARSVGKIQSAGIKTPLSINRCSARTTSTDSWRAGKTPTTMEAPSTHQNVSQFASPQRSCFSQEEPVRIKPFGIGSALTNCATGLLLSVQFITMARSGGHDLPINRHNNCAQMIERFPTDRKKRGPSPGLWASLICACFEPSTGGTR